MNNFKRFYGHHQIDLLTSPKSGRNIVLIGGDNGRGKTSIHEAINYVLYEDGDLPGLQTRPSYLKAVSDRLNRKALDEGQTEYSVALDLIMSSGDAERRFHIERKWEVNIELRRALRPILTIYENDRPIDWIEDNPSAYQDFLRRVLPPRIAPFFFFDGERIQQFAEVEKEGRRMIEAIEDILHITVYKTLRDDIKNHVIEHIEKNEVKKQETTDYYKILEDKERIEVELDDKRTELLDIKRRLEEGIKEQRAIDEELRRIASPHASQRDQLILEKQSLEEEVETAKEDIQKGFQALPILLAGQLCYKLNKVLKEEQGSIVSSPENIDFLRKKVDILEERVFVSPDPIPNSDIILTKEQGGFYRNLFRTTAEDVFGLTSSTDLNLLHDISERERQYIFNRLNEVNGLSILLNDALNRRERLSNELRELESKILSTSDDPYVKELIGQNNNIVENIGRLRQRRITLVGEIQRLEADFATRNRQTADRQKTREAKSEAMRVIKIARKAQEVLDEFIKRLAIQKLEILKNNFEDMYNRLRRSDDPVRAIEIDHETWQIILLGDRNRPLEKRVFSAGMKEIYALALLWALAKTSGREIPIVIDTPVARLDTTNRRALFERYLPFAGHQVIVLSTDTEVDIKWAERLSPYLANQYRLDYNPETDSTIIRPGYFI